MAQQKFQGSYPGATVTVYLAVPEAVAISTITRVSNTVTVVVPNGSGFIGGELVTIAGVPDTSFNGTFTINAAGPTSVLYAQAGSDAASTGGTADSALRLATIYADDNNTPKANPFTASTSDGTWFFYGPNGRYDVRFNGGGLPNPFTLGDFLLYDPTDVAQPFIVITQPPYNAIGDGVTNTTAAFAAAVASGRWIIVPTGTYLVDPIVFSNVTNCTIQGGGYDSVILLGSNGTAWTFNDCGRVIIEKLRFRPAAAFAASNGIVFSFGAGIGTSSCIIDTCEFQEFSQSGVRMVGSPASPISSNRVVNSNFLSNAVEQLYLEYSNDFYILDNQFGVVSLGPLHPQYGAYLSNSSAGTYTGNYHWENVVDFKSTVGNYNRITVNRFENSEREGVILENSTAVFFTNNHIFDNSRSAYHTYDAVMATGLADSILSHNVFFDFSNPTPGMDALTRYNLNLVTCNSLTIIGNRIREYGIAPFNSNFSISRYNTEVNLSGSSVTTIAAGTTAFMGLASSSTVVDGIVFPLPQRGVVARLLVQCVTAPGVGQTFTYTFQKNAIDTAITATITGNPAFVGVDAINHIIMDADDWMSVKVVTSAGAAATQHRWALTIVSF